MPDIVFPPRKVLVPLDLSEASLAAWQQARLFSADFGTKIECLYVQPWLDTAPGFAGQPFFTTRASRAALAELKGRLGPDADVRVVPGVPVDTVLSWDRELGFDLIVMGTHGRTGLERLVKGSMAESVTRDARVPVLVCRGDAARFRNILAPVHFEEYARRGALQAARVAQALGARLTLLHVVRRADEETRRRLAALAADLPGNPAQRILAGDAIETIVETARNFDLVALVAHRKGLLGEMVLGTTAERVLRHATVPVLSIPA